VVMIKQEWIDAFFESLHLHKKYVLQAGLIVGGIPMERLFNHDASKFTEAEYPHYARQFFGDKGDPHGFAQAWLNHIHQNDHHWQHWIFPDGYAPEGSRSLAGVMPMTEVATREMVADWMGASFAYTGSWDMTDWLGKHLTTGKIKLHPETEKILYDVLYSIGYREADNSPLMALYDWSRYPK
jgi:hypothetical protein